MEVDPQRRWYEAIQRASPAPPAGPSGGVGEEGDEEKSGLAGESPEGAPGSADPESKDGWLAEGLAGLREEARVRGRRDAEAGRPPLDGQGDVSSGEKMLGERCRAFFERWLSRERHRLNERVAELEEAISRKLGQVDLKIDRFERITNELVRLKARLTTRRRKLSEELGETEGSGRRGLSTRVYLTAIGFLGLVEFFANAPVFSTLLPRDPLTEQQIRVVTQTATGWFAGIERVLAHVVFRPDAALLAAGVITFLCVLAHFFGHSLRDLVRQRDDSVHPDAGPGRMAMGNVVPLVLAGVGLVLVLGVLYEARVTLGEVGETRYQEGMAEVEELRRQAGWLRTDGDLLAANQKDNQADDLATAAEDLRDYTASMSRMSFPILLLNLTLVLSAISAAYFHRRDARAEQFNEAQTPFEEQRRRLIEEAESVADEVSDSLAGVVRDLRRLRGTVESRPLREWRSVAYQLESVIATYRSENARARDVSPGRVPAFSESVELGLSVDGVEGDGASEVDAEAYERQRERLAERFEKARRRFNEQAMSWGRDDG